MILSYSSLEFFCELASIIKFWFLGKELLYTNDFGDESNYAEPLTSVPE